MDRYQKVEKPRPEEPIHENEIRITSQGLVRNYLSYATGLLQEKQGREIVFKAMGQAISKTVAITEILKRRIPWLHQVTAISSVSITDVWEPIEEGLLPVEQTRKVSMISITLSTKELNKNSPGYQAPSNVEQPKPHQNYQQQRQPLRQPRAPYNAIRMVEAEAVAEVEEDGVGAGVVMETTKKMMDIQTGAEVDMETIKKMLDIQTQAEVDMETTKTMLDIQTRAEVDIETTKKMLDIQTRAEVVVVAEVGGTVVVGMKEVMGMKGEVEEGAQVVMGMKGAEVEEGAEVVMGMKGAEMEEGAEVVMGMKGAEMEEGAEVMVGAVEGWAAAQGVMETTRNDSRIGVLCSLYLNVCHGLAVITFQVFFGSLKLWLMLSSRVLKLMNFVLFDCGLNVGKSLFYELAKAQLANFPIAVHFTLAVQVCLLYVFICLSLSFVVRLPQHAFPCHFEVRYHMLMHVISHI
ncbi:hypothetical protein RHGRI_035942 [Rhododendron griersonianum]|uniref:DNA/RNA-binding protein Alba-like domain-containing protein n=1 Tax=Rhododendron griersonianum TaxID=479676 RepID=A0AAV6HRT5_9ERIC|nr:hypothetical protein RHGRI_035942 [Rhododendron griersonianum]